MLVPNITSTQVNMLLGNDIHPTDVTIHDLNGRLVKNIPLNNSSYYNIDTANLPLGIYFAVVATSTETLVKKFVVDPIGVNVFSNYDNASKEILNKDSVTAKINNDDIVSADAEISVERGSTTNVSVTYTATEDRDISVWFRLNTAPSTIFQAAVLSVSAGSDTVEIPITIPADVPVADYAYRYQILLLPTGQQGYNNSLDAAYITSVSVTDGDSPPPTGIDEIESVDAEMSVARGSTTNVSVTYTASVARDISVWFRLNSAPSTIYQTAVLSVGAGSGTVQIPIGIPPDIAVADNSYRYQILLLPTGLQGYNNSLDAAYITGVSVTDGTSTGIDEIESVDADMSVERGSTTNVSVVYTASEDRDISVLFRLNSAPSTIYQTTVANVSAGSSSVDIPVEIPSDVPVGEYSYRYQILLLPTGLQGYNNQLDAVYVTSVSVTDGVPPTRLVFVFDAAGNQILRKEEETNTAKSAVQGKQQSEVIAESPVAEEEENLDNSVTFFPNPTAGTLTMQWQSKYNEEIQSIMLTDMAGRQIQVDWSKGSVDANVNLTNYAPGLYVVTFHMEDGSVVHKKIIKK